MTAFIGSIFGAGGGGEAANSDLLAKLQQQLGADAGHQAWDDVMLADDPEAPTTTTRRYNYGPLTGGTVTGSVVARSGLHPEHRPARVPPALAASAPARQRASNFLVVSRGRSATGNSLAVMGPQLGYYYPEIVQQIDLHGPGINAQGAAVPGLAMYILIGRTTRLRVEPDVGRTRRSRRVRGAALRDRQLAADARLRPLPLQRRVSPPSRPSTPATSASTPLIYHVSVHGPKFATATVTASRSRSRAAARRSAATG